jgi:3-deoxy-manno-octulosonate cytidylyltransferase (CMP-KDO synthetase)
VIAIIPARYASTRLPGKLLLHVAGKPLILHTVERAKAARTVDRVIVATDDERIFRSVVESGNEAAMTSPDHKSGSDRIAEVARDLHEGSIIVNVQGDEPLISPETIEEAVEAMLSDGADIVTVCEPLTSLHDELLNFNVVKVVFGDDGRAFYFSRSPMPFPRDASLRHGGDPNRALENEPELFNNFRKHIGLYVYSREYLLHFTRLPQTKLEKFESLEQLRALENGAVIKVVESVGTSIGVDTPEDLDVVRLKIEFPNIRFRQGTEDDIPAIANAYIQAVRGSYASFLPVDYLDTLSVEGRSEIFAQRRKNHESYRLLIAEDESDGVVGFIDYAYKESGNFDHDGRIFSFYFVPEFQSRGLGKLLFRSCLRRMSREYYGSVCLDTFEANPYRSFYENMNGRVLAHDDHHVGNELFPTVVYGWDDLSKI